MATCLNHKPPIALGKLVDAALSVRGGTILAQKRSDARKPDPFLSWASQAAEWMTYELAVDKSIHDRSEFYANRRQEILTGTPNAAFWQEATQTETLVCTFSPTCTKPITDPAGSPPYPTNCDAKDSPITSYRLSEANGTDKPLPGWHGEMVENYFRDVHVTTTHYGFHTDIPVNSIKRIAGDKTPIPMQRPVLVVADITTHVIADQSGVITWFIPIVTAGWPLTLSGDPRGVCWWKRRQIYNIPLPPRNLYGWSYTYQQRKIINARQNPIHNQSSPEGFNTLGVMVGTPPSRGRFFGRNTFVTVTNSANVRVFVARGEGHG